jgi:hypothetical protein
VQTDGDWTEERKAAMTTCEICGNRYDKVFRVIFDGASHHFDTFECAIQALAPSCDHCGCRIIGHGEEVDGATYCGPHCARQAAAATDLAGLEPVDPLARRLPCSPSFSSLYSSPSSSPYSWSECWDGDGRDISSLEPRSPSCS